MDCNLLSIAAKPLGILLRQGDNSLDVTTHDPLRLVPIPSFENWGGMGGG
jgi:hypothetical protein